MSTFDGAFLSLGRRRMWVIARPSGGASKVLENQLPASSQTRAHAQRLLEMGGWVLLSRQFAEEHHVHAGGLWYLRSPRALVRTGLRR